MEFTQATAGGNELLLAKIYVNGVSTSAQVFSQIPKGIIGAKVQLAFSGDEWDGLAKTVVFSGAVTRDVLQDGSAVTVPAEAVADSGKRLKVGVYGTDAASSVVIPTLWCDLGPIVDAADPSGDPSVDPELPVWAQLQQQMEDLERQPGPEGPAGYSPTVAVEDIEGGHRVTITDKDGEKTFDVMDGKGGNGGGVTSWNDLTEKPFGSEYAYEPIVWDRSQIETADSVDLTAFGMGKLYKISDNILTREQLSGSSCSGMSSVEYRFLDCGTITFDADDTAELGVEIYDWIMYEGDYSVEEYAWGKLYLFPAAGEIPVQGTDFSVVVPSTGIYAGGLEELSKFTASKVSVHMLDRKYFPQFYAYYLCFDRSGDYDSLYITVDGAESSVELSLTYQARIASGAPLLLGILLDETPCEVPITFYYNGANLWGASEIAILGDVGRIQFIRVVARRVDDYLYVRAYSVPTNQ